MCLAVVTLTLNMLLCCMNWGHRIGQLVEALRYKLEGHRFDS
jgi:hypothetical protein